MNIQHHFREIKRLFFPRWDRANLWRVSTTSKRTVHGFCDRQRRVIEIVKQHGDPDERDRLLIHEICHAIATGHGKRWQGRMEKAAKRADDLGRHRLAGLIRQEIAGYQEATAGTDEAYERIPEMLAGAPNLTLAQVKRSLADEFGLLSSEVGAKSLKRTEKIYRQAKRQAQEAQETQEAQDMGLL